MYNVTLFKYGDGRSPNYYCLYKHPITGKQTPFSCRTPDPEKAKDYATRRLPKVLAKVISESHLDRTSSLDGRRRRTITNAGPPLVQFSEFLNNYLSGHRTKNGRPLREKSQKALRDSGNQFIKRIGNKYLHGITAEDCRRFILNDQPSDRTAEKHWVNLRAVLAAAQREGLIVRNPFESVHRPRPLYSDEEVEARLFNEKDFRKFICNIPTKRFSERRLRNMLIVAYSTGLRLGELRHIKHSWYDLNKRKIRVMSDRSFMTKTVASSRPIPLTDNAFAAISAQIEDNKCHRNEEVKSSPYLFPSLKGSVLSEQSIHNPFRKLRKAVLGNDSKASFHGCRHAFATRIQRAKCSDTERQRVTGHSSIAAHYGYVHIGDEAMDAIRMELNDEDPFF